MLHLTTPTSRLPDPENNLQVRLIVLLIKENHALAQLSACMPRSVPLTGSRCAAILHQSVRHFANMAASNGISAPRTLKLLMLHGYTQSGHLFEIKTKALKKSLEKAFPASPKPGYLPDYPGGIELHYPTGPLKLSYADIPGNPADFDGDSGNDDLEAYGWWRRKDMPQGQDKLVYEGLETGLQTIAECIKSSGPFDGVLGFSQGGAATAFVASLLEDGRIEAFKAAEKKGGMPFPSSFLAEGDEKAIQPPMKFAVSYSGFAALPSDLYQAFYEPKIATPMSHFIGSVDTVISEERCLRLADTCVGGRDGVVGKLPRVVYHPGGHFLPSSQKPYVAALVAFIRETVEGGVLTKKEEESVEDMDVPF